jgi:uncharacterized protein YrzB (UPF0473 family)
MAEQKLSKQELLNKRREENQQQVRATITYECGACGYVVKVEVRPDEHNLIRVPQTYCGACSKTRNFRLISGNLTAIAVKTKKEWDEIDVKPERVADEPETGTKQTDPPTKATSKTKK